MHYVRIPLYLHKIPDLYASRAAETRQIVSAQVHEHQMLRAFFLVREQFVRKPHVLVLVRAPAARARYWAHFRLAAPEAKQSLRRGAHEAAVGHFKAEHVRRWVYEPQGPVRRERIDVRNSRKLLRGHYLNGFPILYIVFGFFDHLYEILARHI